MLAGLIFAVQDAEQAAGLTATCAFGGSTLIEHQARLLAGVGVAQIIVVVGRVTPALLGATARIGRRVPVDVVRSAVGAVEKLHPLAQVIVVADGLVPSPAMLALVAGEAGDALLVTDAAGGSLERIGATTCWAGLAAIGTGRVARVAAMPADYDFQSTLLRAAVDAQATQLRVPDRILADRSHGVERDARRLAQRGHAVAAATIPAAVRWADRLLSIALLRLARYPPAARLEPLVVAAAGLVCGGAGAAAIVARMATIGLALVIIALGVLAFASGLAWLRDDEQPDRVRAWGGRALVISAIAALGYATDHPAGRPMDRWSAGGMLVAILPGAGMLAALVAVAIALLVERAVAGRRRRRWWASPAAYPIVLLPIAGRAPYLGLLLVTGYALITLAAAVEGLRERP